MHPLSLQDIEEVLRQRKKLERRKRKQYELGAPMAGIMGSARYNPEKAAWQAMRLEEYAEDEDNFEDEYEEEEEYEDFDEESLQEDSPSEDEKSR